MKVGLLGFGKTGKARRRLKHESITREAFGNGVMFDASHIGEKEIGLYTMEDLLLPYFNLGSSYGTA